MHHFGATGISKCFAIVRQAEQATGVRRSEVQVGKAARVNRGLARCAGVERRFRRWRFAGDGEHRHRRRGRRGGVGKRAWGRRGAPRSCARYTVLCGGVAARTRDPPQTRKKAERAVTTHLAMRPPALLVVRTAIMHRLYIVPTSGGVCVPTLGASVTGLTPSWWVALPFKAKKKKKATAQAAIRVGPRTS
jgi:hypothetical protein